MKKLEAIIVTGTKPVENSENLQRAKLVITDSENRPEYIEIDNIDTKKEPIVRINFADNTHYAGTIGDLKHLIEFALETKMKNMKF